MTKKQVRFIIAWQFPTQNPHGSFATALTVAISHADDEQLDRLARGYPEEVAAIRRWRTEPGFAADIRATPEWAERHATGRLFG